MNEKNVVLTRTLIWPIALILVALAFSQTQGCVGAPRTVEQISTMEEPQWQSYLVRVSAWSEAAGYTIIKERPDEFSNIVKFTTVLASLTAAPGSAPLASAADEVEWLSPLSKLVLIEIQALLEARGGFPAGERGLELLNTIASGVQTGALDASTEP